MLRAAWVVFVFAAWTGLLLVPVALSVLVTLSGDASAWMARRLWAPVILRAAGVDLQIDSTFPLDPREPYVFMSNHQGLFDIPAAYAAIPKPFRFVAKRSLAYVPILGWYLLLSGHILIDRGNRNRALRSLESAARKIARGRSILIYPEGTRSPDGSVRAFKKGPFVLALAAQVPIVPVAVDGSQHIQPRKSGQVLPGKLRIRIGAPIPTAGLGVADRDRLMRRVRDSLIDAHLAIGGVGGERAAAVVAEREDQDETSPEPPSPGVGQRE